MASTAFRVRVGVVWNLGITQQPVEIALGKRKLYCTPADIMFKWVIRNAILLKWILNYQTSSKLIVSEIEKTIDICLMNKSYIEKKY